MNFESILAPRLARNSEEQGTMLPVFRIADALVLRTVGHGGLSISLSTRDRSNKLMWKAGRLRSNTW